METHRDNQGSNELRTSNLSPPFDICEGDPAGFLDTADGDGSEINCPACLLQVNRLFAG